MTTILYSKKTKQRLFLSTKKDEEQEEEKIKAKAGKSTDSWRVVLRDELTRPEYNRGWFKFKYRGEKYTGRVLHELNPNKFVFLINDVMKGIWINEATIV